MANKTKDYSGLSKVLIEETVAEVATRYGVSQSTIYNQIRKQGIPGFNKRGFGGMSVDQRTKIASLGGSSVKPANRAFSRNRELAAAAGKKAHNR